MKKGDPAICDNMNCPGGYYAKWNKSEKDKYCKILHMGTKIVELTQAESRIVSIMQNG